jgi:hypothetical protein
VVHYGQLVNRFLDWLAARGAIVANPIAELRRKYECRSSAAVLRALAVLSQPRRWSRFIRRHDTAVTWARLSASM